MIIHTLSALIGLFALGIGIFAVLMPQKMSKNFGIMADEKALPYVISTGIRDVFMGLVILVLYYLQIWPALVACSLCIVIVALSDFIVVRKYGDKKISLTHLAGAIGAFVYAGLLYFFG